MINRQEKINERLIQIPAIHKAVYKNAVAGKSRKDAIKAFCLSCVCWRKEEVRQCTSLACELYAFRPYQQRSKHNDKRSSFAPESKKALQRVSG